jgi:hypothetical protein
MPKPYSQVLRDRVIDAVEKGEMSRRAAGRHYKISESVAIKWLERMSAMAPESLTDMAAIVLPSSCRTGTFWRPRGLRNRTSHFRLFVIAFRPSEGSKPTPR